MTSTHCCLIAWFVDIRLYWCVVHIWKNTTAKEPQHSQNYRTFRDRARQTWTLRCAQCTCVLRVSCSCRLHNNSVCHCNGVEGQCSHITSIPAHCIHSVSGNLYWGAGKHVDELRAEQATDRLLVCCWQRCRRKLQSNCALKWRIDRTELFQSVAVMLP